VAIGAAAHDNQKTAQDYNEAIGGEYREKNVNIGNITPETVK
jgi:hypothetical protein